MKKDKQSRMVQNIFGQYTEKEATEFDELRTLDTKVKRPAKVFAYVFGTIGALIFGTGMSMAIGVIAPGVYYGITIGVNMMGFGIGIGLVGMLMALIDYPIYKNVLLARKRKYANQVISLTERIMNK